MNQPPQPSPPGRKPSPWRQPIMWVVVGLPAAVVVAGIMMIVIAGGEGGIDTSGDEVRRMAQVQTTDLSPDETARDGKFSAIVRTDPELGIVEVLPVSGDFDRRSPLRLTLAHPALESADLPLLLQPTDTGWRTDAQVDVSHDWNVQLAPEDAHWRLQGRLPKDQLATNLRPKLQAR